jgi:hypothetical protein
MFIKVTVYDSGEPVLLQVAQIALVENRVDGEGDRYGLITMLGGRLIPVDELVDTVESKITAAHRIWSILGS